MNPDKKDNLNEKAYAFVTDLLTRGELKPGQKLSEPSLAAACGVSRTPMREAVRRLVEEGVLYQVVKCIFECELGKIQIEMGKWDLRGVAADAESPFGRGCLKGL